MGLLTTPLILVRAPVRLTLRAWEFGLSSAAEAARIGMELLDPDRGAPPPDFARRTGPASPGRSADGDAPDVEPDVLDVAAEAPATADVPPSVPDELIPDHVDEEPVLVAEVAEEGAEDGAGPELHVDPPWDGYDQMTAADIRDRLAAASTVEAGAVELYERTHKNRSSVIEASERGQRR